MSLELKKKLLEYSCFTMLWCSVIQQSESLHIYIYRLLFEFPSHFGHHRALSWVPCDVDFYFVSIFLHSSVYNTPFTIHPTLWCPYVSVYVCVSISALQIGSSEPFFWIPHIYVNIWYFFLFWLTSLCMIVSRSTHVSANCTILFFLMVE